VTDSARAGVAARASGSPFIRTSFPASGPNGTLDHVALVTIDRQEALNALSFDLLDELVVALETLDADPDCRAIVLTGAGDRAFAAGADVPELATQTPTSLASEDRFAGSRRSGPR
jgi:enoyl-CoA hydratase/carnithine racemase